MHGAILTLRLSNALVDAVCKYCIARSTEYEPRLSIELCFSRKSLPLSTFCSAFRSKLNCGHRSLKRCLSDSLLGSESVFRLKPVSSMYRQRKRVSREI